MLIPRLFVSIFSLGLMVLGVGIVSGQDFPNKPMRIVTGGVGGGADFVARIIAQGLTASLGQSAIVDNRASGYLPAEIVSKAPPDGYVLLCYGNAFWTSPLFEKAPYDPVRDFSPIALVASSPNVLVVHLSLPVKSVKELIAVAKARPGELNYASVGIGGGPYLSGELFKAMAGVNIVSIPYKSVGLAMQALIGGEVQLMIVSAPTVTPQVKSGRLRALAIGSAKPSALFPELPTIAASGLPGYASESIFGIFAPARTPVTLINRLNQELVRFLGRPDLKEKLINTGLEARSSSPEELGAMVNSDMATAGKLIKDASIRLN